jgi:UDP-N-acetylglucosamine transferase subunit ALG13
VGNSKLPFRRFTDEIARLAAERRLPYPVFLQHGHTPCDPSCCETSAFLDMEEFECRIREAELVILQAGGGAVLTAASAGHVPVVVPRRPEFGEIVDDHQVRNAAHLAGLGLVVAAADPADIEAAVRIASEKRSAGTSERREPALISLLRSDLEEAAHGRKFR